MASTSTLVTPGTRPNLSRLERMMYTLSRRWIFAFGIMMGLYVGLPFFAPVFMRLGFDNPAKLIYLVYSFFCHQLPERSYFLFGQRFTYSLPEIQAAWQNTLDPVILRRFIGNASMGWKVAWSDRMVSMYTSIWLFGLLWWLLRRKINVLPWWGLALFMLPMVIDGVSHFLSDLAGLEQGFRASNAWLVALTNAAFPANFYAGDGWGSFNSIMRLLTGILFGLGIVWFGFPYLSQAFSDWEKSLKYKMGQSPLKSPPHIYLEDK